MSISGKLKEIRTERGLTLEAFGVMIGRSKQYMSQLEKGRIRLTYENAIKIAKALGTKPDELFYE